MATLRSIILAIALLGLTAGLAAAHPTSDESGQWTGHGPTVSDAAQAETPGGYDNHGDYVSSLATGWGEQVADWASDGQSNAAGAHRP